MLEGKGTKRGVEESGKSIAQEGREECTNMVKTWRELFKGEKKSVQVNRKRGKIEEYRKREN